MGGNRRDTATAALERAYRETDQFIAERTACTPKEQDEKVLEIVGPLIAIARPKSAVRGMDWLVVAAMLSRHSIPVEALL